VESSCRAHASRQALPLPQQQASLPGGLRWQHQIRIDDGGPVLEAS
jgi:hypothetical protein